jgi:hypothetical protein
VAPNGSPIASAGPEPMITEVKVSELPAAESVSAVKAKAAQANSADTAIDINEGGDINDAQNMIMDTQVPHAAAAVTVTAHHRVLAEITNNVSKESDAVHNMVVDNAQQVQDAPAFEAMCIA